MANIAGLLHQAVQAASQRQQGIGTGLQAGLSDIGSGLGQFARKKLAQQQALELQQRKQQQLLGLQDAKFQQQIKLEQEKQSIKEKALEQRIAGMREQGLIAPLPTEPTQAPTAPPPQAGMSMIGGGFGTIGEAPIQAEGQQASQQPQIGQQSQQIGQQGGVDPRSKHPMMIGSDGKLRNNPFFVSPSDQRQQDIKEQEFQLKQQEAKRAEDKYKIKKSDAVEVKAKKEANLLADSKDRLETVRYLKDNIKEFGVTGTLFALPGTKKATWLSNFNHLISKETLAIMQGLKDASETGSTGFGQLSEKELALLVSGATKLTRGLPEKDAFKILDGMEKALMKLEGMELEPTQIDDEKTLSDAEAYKIYLQSQPQGQGGI